MTHEQSIPQTGVKLYCKAEAKDGRVCSLYADHACEEHVENHQKSRWKDGE